MILHALPMRDPERLVVVDWKGDGAGVNAFSSFNLMPYPFCRDLHLQKRFFEGVLCRTATTVNLSTGGEHKPAGAEIVSGSYFQVPRNPPGAGQVINDDDQTPGASPVVLLSFDFWKTQLGSAADVVGRKVQVNPHPMTVVGVAAPEFHGIDVGEVPSLWIPDVCVS